MVSPATVKVPASDTSSSRLTVTPFPEATVVTLVPPSIAKPSVRKSMVSEPLSPVMVNPLPTIEEVADVTRPLESTVRIGISVAEP